MPVDKKRVILISSNFRECEYPPFLYGLQNRLLHQFIVYTSWLNLHATDVINTRVHRVIFTWYSWYARLHMRVSRSCGKSSRTSMKYNQLRAHCVYMHIIQISVFCTHARTHTHVQMHSYTYVIYATFLMYKEPRDTDHPTTHALAALTIEQKKKLHH